MENECLFCKIIKGEVPSYTLYENEHFKVILDRFPQTEGHILIISKVHHENIFDMPEELAREIYPFAQDMATRLKKALNAEGMNIVQNNGEVSGQAVFHFHMHLVPRNEGDGVLLNKSSHMDMTLEELNATYERIKEYFR